MHSFQADDPLLPLCDERRIRAEVARLIRQTIGHDRYCVLLFGSRARGTGRPDADWDVAVLFETDGESARMRGPLFRALSDFECDHGIHVDVVVLDPDAAAKSLQLVRNINDEGIPL